MSVKGILLIICLLLLTIGVLYLGYLRFKVTYQWIKNTFKQAKLVKEGKYNPNDDLTKTNKLLSDSIIKIPAIGFIIALILFIFYKILENYL